MDATERERERLRKLAELYDRTDLSPEQYRLEYERLAADTHDEHLNGSTATVPVIDDSMTAFVKNSSAERGPNSSSSSSGASLDQLLHDQSMQPARTRPDVRGTISSSSSSMLPHVRPTIAMRRVRPGLNKLVLAPVVFMLGIGVALAIGMVNAKGVKNPQQLAQQAQTAPVEASQVTQVTTMPARQTVQPFIVPFFGPEAVAQCQTQCDRWGGQERAVCQRGCKRRSLDMYGRRITLDDLNPRTEADAIVSSCFTTSLNVPRAENEQLWRASLQPFVAAIERGDTTKGAYQSKQLYQEIYQAQQQVRMPPADATDYDQVTTDLLRTSCLVAHDALALWAFETVERSDDEFSATFYAQVRNELLQTKIQRITASKREIAPLWGNSGL